ncbi:MAG: TPM domain-containing protein [bacterium]|nr:TPM domain-containing protein [bacterium]
MATGAATLARETRFPDPPGYVSDFAHVVDQGLAQKITSICRELDEKTGAQIGVASFPDMGGDEIDGFTNRLFEQWMPGQKGVNNGILMVNAIAERQIRIEIGYGLEPILPDAVAGRVRRDVMTPLLAEGKYGEAYLAGVAALAGLIAKNENVTLKSLAGVNVPEVSRGANRGRNSNFIPFVAFLVLALIGGAMSKRRNRGGGIWGGGGPWIGGGFGGGFGGGGGGFGGFGGGMSGGGGSIGGY